MKTQSPSPIREHTKRLVSAVLLILLAPLGATMRRNKKAWLFGHSGGEFAGNSKYLYLWVRLYRPDIHATWITRDQATKYRLNKAGFRAVSFWSLKGIQAALTAKVYLFSHGVSDVNLKLGRGAFYVNLWHGIGLKATMYGDKNSPMYKYKSHENSFFKKAMYYEYIKKPDAVITTSEFMESHFSDQFELPLYRCPPLGYSRIDPAFDETLKATSVAIDHAEGFVFPKPEFEEVYIYMPTWRDSGRSFIQEALPDLQVLSNTLSERGALLYIKLHPWTASGFLPTQANIRMWPDHIDIYTYLVDFDCLVTDYSSVLYDFIAVKVAGVILYTFDYDRYMSEDRQLLYSFEDNTTGVRAGDFEELCRIIASGASFEPPENTAEVRRRFWGKSIGLSSPMIANYILAQVG